jgi:hypothetical protein
MRERIGVECIVEMKLEVKIKKPRTARNHKKEAARVNYGIHSLLVDSLW